ncbi:MAG: BatD family protein [Candidatus Omnitrophica bacterium]|nr:BatD family protein [Candidatus Omnitrophota bacterium]
MKKIIILMSLVLHFGPCALADDFEFNASVDSNKVFINSAFNLSLTFSGSQDLPAPDLKQIEGFDWRYIGPATRISIINGARSSSITHNYILTPIKTGSLIIPGFEVEYKGKVYVSEPINMDVSEPQAGHQGFADEGQALPDGNDHDKRVFLILDAAKEAVYAGEKLPVTISLYINNLAVRDIAYPQYAHDGFLMDKWSKPSQYTKLANGISYNVVAFETFLYSLYPGRFTIGPAEIACNLVYKKSAGRKSMSFFTSDPFEDFFTGYEARPASFKSNEFAVEVMPLPDEGRPGDFSGAVGEFAMSVKASPHRVNAGDPITLTIEIQGSGNFDTVIAPLLEKEDGFKKYEPEVSQSFSKKVFQQVIIPISDSVKEIPAFTFSFFDPALKAYKTIKSLPIPIEVMPNPEGRERLIVSSPDIDRNRDADQIEALGKDIVYIKEGLGLLRPAGRPFCLRGLFFVILFIPFVLVPSALIIKRRYERFNSDAGYARKCRAHKIALKNIKEMDNAMAKGDGDRFFQYAIRGLKQYLGDKFHLPSAGITGDIVPSLRKEAIPDDIIREIEEFFNICDMARYAPLKARTKDMEKPYKLFRSIVGKLERSLRMNAKYILITFFLLSLSACACAADFTEERKLYVKSNVDYARGDYEKAVSGYKEILNKGLESGALYYNLGNAYFKNNDLGRAIANYLLALKLMPRDHDLMSNIEYARSLVKNNIRPPHRGPLMNQVFRLSSKLTLDAAAYIFIFLYYLFALAVLALVFKTRGKRFLICLVWASGVLLTIFSFVFYCNLKQNYLDKKAVVVNQGLEARFEPFDTATVYFLLDTGQEVSIVDHGQGWIRVKRPDGRQGWVKKDGIEKV